MQCSHMCQGWMFSLHTFGWLFQTVRIVPHRVENDRYLDIPQQYRLFIFCNLKFIEHEDQSLCCHCSSFMHYICPLRKSKYRGMGVLYRTRDVLIKANVLKHFIFLVHMTPYTPLNIANICNINLLPTTLYSFLLPN